MVRATGLGSGLDVNSLVNELMQAEKIPLGKLNQKKSDVSAKISGYGTLQNVVHSFKDTAESLKSADKFQIYTSKSTDENQFTALTSGSASSGNYTIVVNQLSTAHKIASKEFADASASTASSGTLQISLGGDSFSVTVDSNSDTLNNIKDLINNSISNVGVKATILTVDDGAGGNNNRLVLTADKTGADNTITLTDLSGDVASTLDVSNQLSAAQDLEFTVDGYNVSRSNNIVDDVIEGVTLNFLDAKQDSQLLHIERDDDAIVDSVQEFVDKYNSLLDEISKQSTSALHNDSSLRQLKHGLLNILNSEAESLSDFSSLSEIGIESDAYTGKVSLDSQRLKSAIAQDFPGITRLFSDSSEGFAVKFYDYARDQDKENGIIKIRTDGLNRRITTLDNKIERETVHLESVEKRYYQRFASLDSLMSQLDSTTEYLTQQLSNISLTGIKSKK